MGPRRAGGQIVHRSQRASIAPRARVRAVCRLAAGSVLFLLSFSIPAYPAASRFDAWTTENGLPQNSVLDIMQTRDGYLWLATEGGLVRFDGVRFTVFDRSTDGIESQRIRKLYEARNGTLWAATSDGFLIRYSGGRFSTFGRAHGLPKAGVFGAGPGRIEEDGQGWIWVTWIGVVTRFDGKRATNFEPADFGLPVQRHDGYRYRETWWKQEGATLFALGAGHIETHALPPVLAGVSVTGVHTDPAGNLWVRTDGAGVLEITNGRTRRYTVDNGLPRNNPDGLFFADGPDGFWYIEATTDTLYRIRAGAHERSPIHGVGVVYTDREGSTWIGANASGLYRVRDEMFAFYSERDGLPAGRPYSVLEDRSGAVWIGTWDAGLSRYAAGRFTAYSTGSGMPSTRVSCLYEDRAGRLWVGTDRGLAFFEDGKFRRFTGGAGLLDGSVWAILEDQRGVFWFGTEAGLVFRDRDRFSRYTTADGLSHNHASLLFEDRSGALWVGGYLGVTRLLDGKFTSFTAAEGLIGNEIRAFHEDGQGVLWIGTYDGGLYRLAGDRLTRYTKTDGLPDNGVFQILEDDDGKFWMGSNRGIARVSRAELNEVADGRRRSVNAVVFGTRQGLATAEINGGRPPSGWRARDGRFWFPTMGGVAVVDPAKVHIDTPAPVPIVEEVNVAGETSPAPRTLTLEPHVASFEVRYTAPAFMMPEQVHFRYRLTRQPATTFTADGTPAEWNEVGDRRSVSFHRLPPGQYTFEIAAAGQTGVWSDTVSALQIKVLPPIWETWGFRLLATAIVTVSIVAIHVGRVRRLRREQARRSAYLQELIDSQERERRRISNEMHDSIGYDLALLKRYAREGRERSDGDEAAAASFDEIVDVADRVDSDMKTIAFALRPYHLDRIGLTRSIEALVPETGGADEPAWSTAIADIDGVFPKELEIHVYRIAQEGVSNVLKHANARRARLTVSRNAEHVEIRIEDDGAGLDGSPEGAVAAATDGMGLIGIRERAQLLGGDVTVDSSHKRGTVIVVRLRTQGAIHA